MHVPMPQSCPTPGYGDLCPGEGVMPARHPVPFAPCSWSLVGAGWDGSVLLSPAEITQKVIVSRGKGGAEAV